MLLTKLQSLLMTYGRSLAIILGFATLAAADDAKILDKPITAEERDHWAFRPPTRPGPPVVKGHVGPQPDRCLHPGWLEANGLSPFARGRPADAAAPAELRPDRPAARRPTRSNAFLDDRSADAYERLVDRLLASPQYGDRWAQHWLDLARYADTDGFEFDQARPDAWRYRDWVVKALNRDLPYDQFVRLQLAGDEVAPDDPGHVHRDRVQPLLSRHGRPERPGIAAAECAERHHRDNGPGLSRPDDRLRPVPRPQVRPDPPDRLLPAPGVLHAARFRDDYPLASTGRRKAHETALAGWRAEVAKVQAAILRIEKPIRDRLAPGLPMGSLDDAVAAYNKSRSRAQPGRGLGRLRDPQPRRTDQGQGLARPAR